MYSGKTVRERNINFVLPIAKRQIMFSEDEYLQNSYYGFNQIILKEDHVKELELFQITEAYPIVKYYSENTNSLNRFAESITVAIVSETNLGFDEKHNPKKEIIEDDIVAYITNPFNVSTKIHYYELCKLLYQKPKLTVTNEGVLLFYTPTILFATLDCRSGNIIEVEELAKVVNNDVIKKIHSIFVQADGTTVITFLSEEGKELYKQYKLSMLFDFFSEIGVTVKISEYKY